MKKNIKNNVITRMMAIGLATVVLATSVPSVVFADEETTTEESSSDSSSESSESSSDSSSDCGSSESEAPAAEAPAAEAPAVEPVEAPAAEVPAVEPVEAPVAEGEIVAEVLIIDNNVTTPVVEEETPAVDEATKEDVLSLKADAEEKIEKADKSIDNLNEKTGSVNEGESKTDGEADSAIANAEIANTSKSKKEAYQAKADAINDITSAEDDLENVKVAYEEAVVANEQAEADVKAAEEAHAKAVEQLNELKKTTQQNLTAAQAQYNDACSRIRIAEEQKANAEAKLAELKPIEAQYYAVMDYYYKTYFEDETITKNNTKNGVLDVSGCLKDAKDKQTDNSYIDSVAKTETDKTPIWERGRALMEDLIRYKLKEDKITDYTITTADSKIDGTYKLAKDVSSGSEETHYQKWDSVAKNHGNVDGRFNHITVTYKDSNGEDQYLYFNYVFKQSEKDKEFIGKDGKVDIENGPIYLALLDYSTNPKNGWVTWDKIDHATTKENIDNYGSLKSKVDSLQQAIDDAKKEIDDATAAKNAAAARVSQYSQELRELNNIKIDDSKIAELKEKLADAVEDLKEAEEKKEELEVKVEEARKIVDAIDLSRFNTNDDESADDYTDGTDPVVPVYPLPTIPTVTDISDIIPTIPSVLPTVITSIPRSGVLGVRVEASADNVVSDVDKKPANAIKEIDLGNKTVANNGQKLVKLANNEVPLAAMPNMEDGINMNWLWLLLVAAAVIITIATYEKHKKNVAANKANSSNK